MNFILVGLGGMLGSVLRYLLSSSFSSALSYPTALINLLGSFVMGVVLALGQERLGASWSLFLMTGILGGFTTYSAFAGETLILLRGGLYFSALGYAGLTLLGGLLAVGVGHFLGRLFL